MVGKMSQAWKLIRNQSCGCERPHCKKKHHGYGEITKTFWCDVLRGAKSRNVPVEITMEDAWNLFLKQNKKCAITGKEIHFAFNSVVRNGTASLDQIIAGKGYIVGNVQWVHRVVNRLKWDLEQSQLIEWCRAVVKYADAV